MTKNLAFIALLLVLVCTPIVSATSFTLTNSTTYTSENETYPETLFYTIFLVGAVMTVFNIRFITSKVIPGPSLVLTSTLGFCAFMICAWMAPFVSKQVWIVSGTDAQFVSTYLFSSWVTYFMLALSIICFLQIWYGVLMIWINFADEQKRDNDPDFQFNKYMNG
jgi:hypothetical protein